ncbi:efflux RND transporter periplasmic adaptor subunit [Chromobacterium alticapitis]|uniref:Efflux transporter periplasmic adaptor subunit n=1 Tax=Chromobacterium alticapitis TaxID=2073169 RepID=A0A2S5DCF9_9NEIS|nr:efflux RND transporter periplasmic adaptor subunit [Chromobacterium alticapitis]POZ60682.1 efflux transporter periplasmic adaptor subunit [Chromobacterium alticapitis]
MHHPLFRPSWLCLILPLLAACAPPRQAAEPAPPTVTLQTLRPHSVPLRMELVGETAGYRDVQVRPRVGGILLKRAYVEGQAVKKGQALFMIDPAPYQAVLEQALGAQAESQATLDKATADRKRIEPLFKEDAVSRMDYDNAVAAHNAARAVKQAADAKVKEARLNLGYTRVDAPIAGMTSKQALSEGSLIRTDSDLPLTTITQLDPLYVNFAVSEQDQLNFEHGIADGSIQTNGQKARVRIRLADGSEYPLSGELNFHDNRVDPRTGTISRRAIFSNPQGKLLPGQFVRVLLDLGTRNDVITVPETAIIQSQTETLVLLVDKNNRVQSRPVKLGAQLGKEVVVESGLAAGERLVVDGLMKAQPGATVRVAAEERK